MLGVNYRASWKEIRLSSSLHCLVGIFLSQTHETGKEVEKKILLTAFVFAML